MTKWVHTQHITEHNTYWKNREHYRRGKTFYSLFLSKWFSCPQISYFWGKKELWSEWKGIVVRLPLEHVCKLAAGLRWCLRAQNGLQLPPSPTAGRKDWRPLLIGFVNDCGTAERWLQSDKTQCSLKFTEDFPKVMQMLLATRTWSLAEGNAKATGEPQVCYGLMMHWLLC